MKDKKLICIMVLCTVLTGLTACKIDMPKEPETSFETMVVDTTDIEIPIKFSAKMKGQSLDVSRLGQIA